MLGGNGVYRRRGTDNSSDSDERERRYAFGCAHRHNGARSVAARRRARFFVPQGHTLPDRRIYLYICVCRVDRRRHNLARRIVAANTRNKPKENSAV